MEIVCIALSVYTWILLARIILSWVTMAWSPPSSLSPVIRGIYDLTEPVLGPVRRALPPMAGFDFSPLLIFIALSIARNALGCGGIF